MKEITATELRRMQAANEQFLILDVREPYETELCGIGGLCVPMGQLIDRIAEIPTDIPVVVHCRSGARSCAVIDALSSRYGFANLINLKGGILAWKGEVDPSMHCD